MIESSTRKPLLAGAARAVITPPVGIRMMGYTVQESVSQSVERELTATALVLSDGPTKAVIVACDLLFIQNPHIDQIRQSIGRRAGVPAEHVLVNFSHTHLGPMLPGWQREPAEQHVMQERYLAVLEDQLAGAAAAANARLAPARLGVAKGHVPLGTNRRERLADGRVIIGENPTGAVDHELGVVRVDFLNGQPLATILIAACHTVVLGPKTTALSPDFVGAAREIVERASGAPALFLQACAGNINPACGIGTGGPEQYDDLARMGAMLGGETLKAWAGIRTHNRHGPRRVVQSVAAISAWDYEALPSECVESFGIATRRTTLDMAPLPDRTTAEAQLGHARRACNEARAQGKPPGVLNVVERLLAWAELVHEAVVEGGKRPKRELVGWALRINDLALVAVNGEPFAELGLEVKRRSVVPNTFLLGYSNGCLGYLPTPEAFDEGGMEVVESYRNYLLPTGFTREWGPAVVEIALEMINELEQKSE
ncbi:MAG TPA: neutral/alkaline non-lysosomal ceramidase N-terminal domain-containing protein [Pirellulales bacterium]|nr:neutral/alkaline non-lysosomal ceramidase N-terminal domain-containing protein [Pirellulales bacterium]